MHNSSRYHTAAAGAAAAAAAAGGCHLEWEDKEDPCISGVQNGRLKVVFQDLAMNPSPIAACVV